MTLARMSGPPAIVKIEEIMEKTKKASQRAYMSPLKQPTIHNEEKRVGRKASPRKNTQFGPISVTVSQKPMTSFGTLRNSKISLDSRPQ